ncbi:hypothetical protein Q8A73_010341 [Channa argus]|nr:hypothetical protein Q8A73_010341 [Channa argus]
MRLAQKFWSVKPFNGDRVKSTSHPFWLAGWLIGCAARPPLPDSSSLSTPALLNVIYTAVLAYSPCVRLLYLYDKPMKEQELACLCLALLRLIRNEPLTDGSHVF